MQIDKDIFERALLQEGREAFVSLFLDNGFEVHRYLDANTLIKLFQYSLKETFLEVCWEGILGNREVCFCLFLYLSASLAIHYVLHLYCMRYFDLV